MCVSQQLQHRLWVDTLTESGLIVLFTLLGHLRFLCKTFFLFRCLVLQVCFVQTRTSAPDASTCIVAPLIRRRIR